jgi:hypothetical protein
MITKNAKNTSSQKPPVSPIVIADVVDDEPVIPGFWLLVFFAFFVII